MIRHKNQIQQDLGIPRGHSSYDSASLPHLCSSFVDATISTPSSSIHETTLTKSATNEGIVHFKIAELPRITYS